MVTLIGFYPTKKEAKKARRKTWLGKIASVNKPNDRLFVKYIAKHSDVNVSDFPYMVYTGR